MAHVPKQCVEWTNTHRTHIVHIKIENIYYYCYYAAYFIFLYLYNHVCCCMCARVTQQAAQQHQQQQPRQRKYHTTSDNNNNPMNGLLANKWQSKLINRKQTPYNAVNSARAHTHSHLLEFLKINNFLYFFLFVKFVCFEIIEPHEN